VAVLFAVLGCGMVAMELRWRYILAVFVVLYGTIMVIAYKYGQQQYLLEQQRRAAAEVGAPAGGVADRETPAREVPLPEAPVPGSADPSRDVGRPEAGPESDWSAHKPA